MKENNNIEELFKQKFDGFEGNVDPSAWTNIQQGINSAGASGATGAGLSGIAKVAIITSIVSATAISVWYFSGNEKETLNELPVVAQNDIVEENTDESLQTIGENILVTDTNDPIITNNIVEIQDELNEIAFNPEDINNDLVDEILGVEIINDVVEDNYENNEGGNEEVSEDVNHIEDVEVDDQPQIKKVKCYIEYDVYNNEVEFTSNAKNHSEVKWEFGDGASKIGDNVAHEYAKPGNYVVKAHVNSSDRSKTRVFSKEVTIEGTSRIEEIPNVISPSNNDGTNDYFVIESEGIETFYISIVVPTGKEVFTSNDANFEWHGQNRSGVVEPGKYIYTIIAQGEDGQRYKDRGGLVVR